jgi:hypothetical protein
LWRLFIVVLLGKGKAIMNQLSRLGVTLLVGFMVVIVAMTTVAAKYPKVFNTSKCVASGSPAQCLTVGDATCARLLKDGKCEGKCVWCNSTNAVPDTHCVLWEHGGCEATEDPNVCETAAAYYYAKCETSGDQCKCTKNKYTDSACGTRINVFPCDNP